MIYNFLIKTTNYCKKNLKIIETGEEVYHVLVSLHHHSLKEACGAEDLLEFRLLQRAGHHM